MVRVLVWLAGQELVMDSARGADRAKAMAHAPSVATAHHVIMAAVAQWGVARAPLHKTSNLLKG